ncbi:MAG: hypothetical protein CM1200mP28_00550 [Deltaproteobacteria bacterium]|nr:MAG: hypothetical protein CM1200mP28_00550 [Deltaproteobacteria bacterium]
MVDLGVSNLDALKFHSNAADLMDLQDRGIIKRGFLRIFL